MGEFVVNRLTLKATMKEIHKRKFFKDTATTEIYTKIVRALEKEKVKVK